MGILPIVSIYDYIFDNTTGSFDRFRSLDYVIKRPRVTSRTHGRLLWSPNFIRLINSILLDGRCIYIYGFRNVLLFFLDKRNFCQCVSLAFPVLKIISDMVT